MKPQLLIKLFEFCSCVNFVPKINWFLLEVEKLFEFRLFMCKMCIRVQLLFTRRKLFEFQYQLFYSLKISDTYLSLNLEKFRKTFCTRTRVRQLTMFTGQKHPAFHLAAVVWLKYCRYGVKHKLHNKP